MQNGLNIQSENLLIELESFKKSDTWHCSEEFWAVLELCLIEFEKKLFLTNKLRLPKYSSLHTK